MRAPQPFFAEHDDWLDVEVREGLACARRQQGQFECRLFRPDELDPQLAPEQLAVYEQLSSARETTCGVNEGALWCWGHRTELGQLGDGRDRFASDDCETNGCGPVQVTHPSGERWLSVQTCSDHSCALDGAKNLFCWGSNEYSQLGLGSREAPGVEECRGGACAGAPVALGAVEMCTPESVSSACEPPDKRAEKLAPLQQGVADLRR